MPTLDKAIPIQHVMRNVTMTVYITGLVKYKVQVWVACRLIRLAAKILNMDVKVK